jgi:hypothetical protein
MVLIYEYMLLYRGDIVITYLLRSVIFVNVQNIFTYVTFQIVIMKQKNSSLAILLLWCISLHGLVSKQLSSFIR